MGLGTEELETRGQEQGRRQLSAWACGCTGGSEGAKDAGVTISSENQSNPGRFQGKVGQQGFGIKINS